MSFELREHTADVAVEATGDTIEAVFEAVARGLVAASCDDVPPAGERFSFSVTAESREALLFEFLDELIYERDVREALPVEPSVRIDREGEAWTLEGTARAVALSVIDAREVKAVTYSEMRLEERDGEWTAYIVFDV